MIDTATNCALTTPGAWVLGFICLSLGATIGALALAAVATSTDRREYADADPWDGAASDAEEGEPHA